MIYTWVDGSLPGYLEERQKYSEKPIDMNPERYRDTFQNLRYSLRSVATYLPWVNMIYIVTNRPQIPAWLDPDHPQIKVIHLDEFIPDAYLPTFCSNAIESFLHLIPGLSEHFIYMCDDFFFLRETKLTDFWKDGIYAILGTLIGENLKWRVYAEKNNIIGTGFVEHGPHFARKSYWKAMTEMRPVEMEATRRRKFRHPENLVTFKLYRTYMLEQHRAISRPVRFWTYTRFAIFVKLVNDLKKMHKALDRLRSRRPNFYCLNDDLKGDPNPEIVALVRSFLAETYPKPSPFELAEVS
ncbi:MAG: hypothetical protein Q9M48_07415 [Rhodobacterales bacterium]|nr:hypothetical protein [Rhodobacterales bacterium]